MGKANIMKFKMLFIFLALASGSTSADDRLERSEMTGCSYEAGTAREVQKIRQSEGDDWQHFEQKIQQMYGDTQGRKDLLDVAKMVYLEPAVTLPDEVYSRTFDRCLKHAQGQDTSA